ncbi:hypothetical protein [Sphaerothrix gracilis]|uniref:hypothetical protein n=1 Tax=Sphaerothrix gracilis TaxID=3151835 RepID=UPI0031FCB917
MKVLIAIVSGISTTLGQALLLHLVVSGFMAVNGIWVVLSLLIFNCGVAGLAIFFLAN